MTPESAILGRIADDYAEIQRLRTEIQELRALVIDLEQLAAPADKPE